MLTNTNYYCSICHTIHTLLYFLQEEEDECMRLTVLTIIIYDYDS